MHNRKRVAVTGMGIATASGLDLQTFWQNLSAGKSGIKKITQLDTSDFKTTAGGEIDSELITATMKKLSLRLEDRTVNLALLASAQALTEAGVIKPDEPPVPSDTAVIFGTGVGSANTMFATFSAFMEKGVKGVRPTTIPRCMVNAVTAQLSLKFRLTGPNYVTICACSSATTAIGTAFRMIRDGYATRVLSGGADSFFDPLTFSGWNNLGVMSKNTDPEKACRPFDSNRDGCVLGEGAGALVLENMDSALARGAMIRGEVVGFGESSDAEHITSPSVEGQTRAIKSALDSAGIGTRDVSLVNAHGTATIANDTTESASIRSVFGDYADDLPVVSNKSYFGHLLGASGAAETVASILMLENRLITPNLNLDNQDPECKINLPKGTAIDLPGNIIVKNSFGFGGNNAVLVLKRAAN